MFSNIFLRVLNEDTTKTQRRHNEDVTNNNQDDKKSYITFLFTSTMCKTLKDILSISIGIPV